MLHFALIFLIVALVVGILGFTGIVAVSATIAWALFGAGLLLSLIMVVLRRFEIL